MKATSLLAVSAALFAYAGTASGADCVELSVSVKHAVEAQKTSVLEIVEAQVAANPSCACEIVKAAIEASEADSATVAAIVETAATAAPDQMRLIAQCAVAVAPDSLSDVQAVMIRIEPSSGEVAMSDAKSAKSPKAPIEVKPAWNPLDFPGSGVDAIGQGLVGPNPGSPGGDGGGGLPGVTPNPPVVNNPVGTETDLGFGSGMYPFPYYPYFNSASLTQ